jgi:peptidoglycan/LPS O-acetylase OafA/YrhL
LKKTQYFPNLNGLRFVAALLVMIAHVELFKGILGLPNHFDSPFVSVVGKLGVVLFFVLSGFLITFLLLSEKKQTGTISVRNFYVRRILRIWPLYYLVIAGGFFLFPQFEFLSIPGWTSTLENHFWMSLSFYVFFLPNVVCVAFHPIPFIVQAWSIGVEEQFYLVWPVLVKKFEKTWRMLLGVIAAYLGIKFFLRFAPFLGVNPAHARILSDIWYDFSIDCMAIGGLVALPLIHEQRRVLNVLFNKVVQAIAYALVLAFFAMGVRFPFFHYEIYAVLFAVIIVNLAGNSKSVVSLENRPMHYLGTISYGLYMYHPLAIVIVLKILIAVTFPHNVVIYAASVGVTILMASLSYELVERRFIQAKARYSAIVSGVK